MIDRILIAPSILAADFTRLGEQVKAAEEAGADLIHIDVMDGRFVPNITMGALVVEAVRRITALPLDVHLMIVEPERHIEAFAKAGATAISVHYEASPNLHRTLGQIQKVGCRAGVAINPHTPAGVLSEVLEMLDVIIVMTVNPGFGGQAFIKATLPKIAQLRTMIAEASRDTRLEADGGINVETVSAVVEAGANVLIAGSVIFNRQYSVREGIESLRTVGK